MRIFAISVVLKACSGKISLPWESNRMAGRRRIWTTVLDAPRQSARALVKAYRYTLSPWIGLHCRHLPTCSDYADEALGRYGLWAGGWMTLARLLRCHPFGTSGLDFVPDHLPERSRWYLPWRYGKWSWSGSDPAGQGNSRR
jgi:putative membrane protein insertion efficiency factor